MVIRYAGFDPEEEDLRALQDERISNMSYQSRRRQVRTIDVELAIELRALGEKWPAIGKLLAVHDKRAVPYTADAVKTAVRRHIAATNQLKAGEESDGNN